MIILAIDPGSVSGALCLHGDHPLQPLVDDLPVVDRQVDAAGLAMLIDQLRPDVAVVERVGAMPKQGVTSTFRFGVAVGIIHGCIASHGIPMHLVTPNVWKRHFSLGPDKEAARALAIRLYPSVEGLARKKDAGRAEALLIAHWFATKG